MWTQMSIVYEESSCWATSESYNWALSEAAASAKLAILVSGPEFDTGANNFLLFSQGEKALFTECRQVMDFFFF